MKAYKNTTPKYAYYIGFNLDKSRNIKEINHFSDTSFNEFYGAFNEDMIQDLIEGCSKEFDNISKEEIDVRKVNYRSGKIIWEKSGDRF